MSSRGEYANELVGRGGHGGGHGGRGGRGRGHRGRRRGRGRGHRFFGGWGGWDGWGWGPWRDPWDWYGGSPYDYGDDVDDESDFGPLVVIPAQVVPAHGYHVQPRRVNYLMGVEPPSISAFVGCDACGDPCFVAVDDAASR